MQNEIQIPKLPELCDACGDDLLEAIRPGGVVTKYCEHNKALLIAVIDDSEFRRWIAQGPLSATECLAVMKGIIQEHPTAGNDGGRVH